MIFGACFEGTGPKKSRLSSKCLILEKVGVPKGIASYFVVSEEKPVRSEKQIYAKSGKVKQHTVPIRYSFQSFLGQSQEPQNCDLGSIYQGQKVSTNQKSQPQEGVLRGFSTFLEG